MDERGERVPTRGTPQNTPDDVTCAETNGETRNGAPSLPPPAHPEMHIYPMVMSIGWNPFYKNTVRSVEVHLLHTFASDFYGAWVNLLIVGFIRPEYDYVSTDALIEDIRTDIEVARRSLAREGDAETKRDKYLYTSPEGEAEVGS